MRFNILTTKDLKEFVHIIDCDGIFLPFTSAKPEIRFNLNVTMEDIMNIYTDIDFSGYELKTYKLILDE